MPKRRSWGRGARLAHGISSGANDFFTMMMRDIGAQRAAERTADMQEKRDARTLQRQGEMMARSQAYDSRQKAFGSLPELVEKLGPEGAMNMLSAQGVDLFPPMSDADEPGTGEYQRERAAGDAATSSLVNSLRTPMRRKLESTVGANIEKAQSPEQLDTNSIMSQILAADDRAVPGESEPGMRVGGLRPEAYEYIDRAQGKADALRSKPGERLTITNPDGSKSVSTPSQADFARGPIQTELPAAQAGALKGQSNVAEKTAELDPAFQELQTRTMARMQNLSEALTRQAKIDTAGGIAGAQAQARLSVETSPEAVAAEVAKAQAMESGSTKSTESERRAAANWTPLVNAHANALTQETSGSVLTPGAVEITGSSWLNPVLGSFVDPTTARYAQSARDFVMTLGYIRSGVAVRPDEVDKFLATMFAFEGDAPQQIKQKQQSREILLGAMQAMVGRSAPEAARVLATAINNGQIPMGILTSVEIRPEIAKHMLPQLTGVPQFDVNGNVIGVRPR